MLNPILEMRLAESSVPTFIAILKTVDRISGGFLPFQCLSDGVQFRTMNPSHSAMIDVVLDRAGFREFDCYEEKLVTMQGIALVKFIVAMKKGDEVEIKINKKEGQFIHNRRRRFFLFIKDYGIEFISELPKIELDLTTKISGIPLSEFRQDLLFIQKHSEFVRIADGRLIAGASEDSYFDIEVDYNVISDGAYAETLYSVQLILDFIRDLGAVFDTATIEYSTDYAMVITVQNEWWALRYWVAPRVEEEEDEDELEEEQEEDLEELEDELIDEPDEEILEIVNRARSELAEFKEDGSEKND